jgi:hypothetical protein
VSAVLELGGKLREGSFEDHPNRQGERFLRSPTVNNVEPSSEADPRFSLRFLLFCDMLDAI